MTVPPDPSYAIIYGLFVPISICPLQYQAIPFLSLDSRYRNNINTSASGYEWDTLDRPPLSTSGTPSSCEAYSARSTIIHSHTSVPFARPVLGIATSGGFSDASTSLNIEFLRPIDRVCRGLHPHSQLLNRVDGVEPSFAPSSIRELYVYTGTSRRRTVAPSMSVVKILMREKLELKYSVPYNCVP